MKREAAVAQRRIHLHFTRIYTANQGWMFKNSLTLLLAADWDLRKKADERRENFRQGRP
jgi:hypothetical protein